MLNDVLAVGVAGTVVVVIATILGAVELLRKARRGCCRSLKLPTGLAATEDEVRTTTPREEREGSTRTPARRHPWPACDGMDSEKTRASGRSGAPAPA